MLNLNEEAGHARKLKINICYEAITKFNYLDYMLTSSSLMRKRFLLRIKCIIVFVILKKSMLDTLGKYFKFKSLA